MIMTKQSLAESLIVSGAGPLIADAMGRSFATLRLSVTDRCNFACVYCAGDSPFKADSRPFRSAEEIFSSAMPLIEIAGIKKIRITGGEPTLHPGLVDLVALFGKAGLNSIHLTTNGWNLRELVLPLRDAGLTSLNVSLDAAGEEGFRRMARRGGFAGVLHGIDVARALLPVKINCTLVRGQNENEILPVFKLARSLGVTVRYLELMAMGPLRKDARSLLVKEQTILDAIATEESFTPVPTEKSSTAHYFRLTDGYMFGVIANESMPFCSDCNRLRMDARGNIYGCISDARGININGLQKSELENALRTALSRKQPVRFVGSEKSMQELGG